MVRGERAEVADVVGRDRVAVPLDHAREHPSGEARQLGDDRPHRQAPRPHQARLTSEPGRSRPPGSPGAGWTSTSTDVNPAATSISGELLSEDRPDTGTTVGERNRHAVQSASAYSIGAIGLPMLSSSVSAREAPS